MTRDERLKKWLLDNVMTFERPVTWPEAEASLIALVDDIVGDAVDCAYRDARP